MNKLFMSNNQDLPLMLARLEINLEKLPEEGIDLEGELDSALFDFSGEEVKASGPLCYSLHVQRFDEELFVQGCISSCFTFICARCLSVFEHTIELPHFAASVEIEGRSQIDITEILREDLVLEIPHYPKCEDAGQECKEITIKSDFGLDNSEKDVTLSPSSSNQANIWDALDSFGK